MSAAEFETQFSRLTTHFHLPADSTRDTLAVDWLKALQHYHVDALEHGVTELIQSEQERYWPALGKLVGIIKARIGRYDRAHQKCDTCQGRTWIEVQPWKVSGWIYTGFRRCPDCGVPAPTYTPIAHREELTASEYQAVMAGTFQEPSMPLSKANHAALEALQFINAQRGMDRLAGVQALKAKSK